MSAALVKNNNEAFFTDKKRNRFRQQRGRGSKGDVDKSRGNQQENSSETGEAQKNRNNGSQY